MEAKMTDAQFKQLVDILEFTNKELQHIYNVLTFFGVILILSILWILLSAVIKFSVGPAWPM
jgi:hypothetical protein